MAVAAAKVYRDGKPVREIDVAGLRETDLGEHDFVWIGLVEPTSDEMEELREHFDLHPLAVEDALKAHELPKVDVYGDQLFVVARTVHRSEGVIGFGETHIFVGRRHIITVRHGADHGYAEVRRRLQETPDLLRHGVDYVLHAVLDHIVDAYQPIIHEIEQEVYQFENRALDAFLEREEVGRIFTLRRDLMKFHNVLGPMADVASKLEHVDLPCIDDAVRPYFGDVLDHIRIVLTMSDGLRDLLSSIFEVSALLEQQRLGATTRKLAAWAALLAVPTAIAGIYGMNFKYMPELKWHYGYFMVLGVIAGLCGILYVRFRRSGWL